MPRKLSPAAVEAARRRYAGSGLERYNNERKAKKATAVQAFQSKPEKAQKADLKKNDPKAPTLEAYTQDTEKYDYPGVDTKYAKKKYHKSAKRVESAKNRFKGSALERYNKERAARKASGATFVSRTTVGKAKPVPPPPVNKPPPPPVGPAPKPKSDEMTAVGIAAYIDKIAQKPKNPRAGDFDKLYPIPKAYKNHYYVYTQGSSSSEAYRKFILRPSDKVRLTYLPWKDGRAVPAPKTVTYESLAKMSREELNAVSIKLDQSEITGNQQTLGVWIGDAKALFLDEMSDSVVFYGMEDTVDAQIRRNGKIVFQYDYEKHSKKLPHEFISSTPLRANNSITKPKSGKKTTSNALGVTLARLQTAIETVAPEGMDIDGGYEPQSGGELEETNNPVGAAVAVVDDGASAVAVPVGGGNVVIDVVSGATRFIENITGQ